MYKAQSIKLESKKAAKAAFFDEHVSEIIGEADVSSIIYNLYSIISFLVAYSNRFSFYSIQKLLRSTILNGMKIKQLQAP